MRKKRIGSSRRQSRSTRVTSLDVARHAGVSQSAVSRAFTEGASVSDAMSKRVLKSAREIGYRPNVLARSLITGRSNMVALVVAYLDNQFYPDALERFSRAFQEQGYHILIFLTPNGSDEKAQAVVVELLDYQVDGIVAASISLSERLTRRCQESGIPLLLFNRHQGKDGPASVTSDNFNGARRIAKFLVETGYRRIAHISGWRGSSTGREREDGFRQGLAEYGMSLVDCRDGMYDRQVAMEMARHMCSIEAHRPDAIFVGNDHMAFGVLDVLRHELNLRVPEDVAVVGYDDVEAASWKSYDLTTFSQPIAEMVDTTVAELLQRMETPDKPFSQTRLQGELILRGTTGRREKT